MRASLALLVLPALALPAAAQEIAVHTDEVPSTAMPFTLPMAVPKFDPDLGVLARVEARVMSQVDGAVGAENILDIAVIVTATQTDSESVTGLPDLYMVGGAIGPAVVDLESFDGVLDFAGRSGFSFPHIGAGNNLFIYTAPADLAFFTGPAGNPGQVDMVADFMMSCTFDVEVSPLSDLVEELCVLDGAAQVEVTYVFGPDCNENGIADFLDICPDVEGPDEECSEDCNENGVPDECEPDCDEDGIPDDCDSDSCESSDLACEEFDRFEDLTPNDTLSVVTSLHNPQQEQGYLYAYAVSSANQGVGFDHLIGHLLVVNGLEAFEYSVNPVDYRAAVEAGELTDVDADGVRDLNGLEYEKTAGEVLVPRFLGNDPGRGTHGDLILIALSGGTQFTTTADFLVYNDDEDVFSANRTFFCWDKVDTLEISTLFSNEWLTEFSGQNPLEGLGALEYGWFRVEGGVASSSFFSLLDPAVYAVYVERVGGTAAADLPFETCTQSGHLLPRAVSGDNEEESGAPSDEDCEDLHTGRKPASLLLYPEFDNRSGVATVLSVTNTSETDDVRVHFVYLGRYGN